MILCLTPALPVCAFDAVDGYAYSLPSPCVMTLPNGEQMVYRIPKDPPKPKRHGFWHKAGVVFLFLLL